MDFLIAQKEADKVEYGNKVMTEENIRIVEELAKQIDFMKQLKVLANNYGFDISNPCELFCI